MLPDDNGLTMTGSWLAPIYRLSIEAPWGGLAGEFAAG
jgi:hypothetical protein